MLAEVMVKRLMTVIKYPQVVSIILDVLANDTFENKEGISIIDTSQPNNGNVVINEDNTLTYTPDEILATEPVTDTFTYTAEVQNKDGTVTSGEADVNIIIEVNASRENAVVNISPCDTVRMGTPLGVALVMMRL